MAPRTERIQFPGQDGSDLVGRMEWPAGEPTATAIFAHCFTCSKDVLAATRVSRALAARGFAVLRFDFTGLGASGGDFANTNFSSNIDDLIHAAAYLRDHHAAPSLLVGHSLGGAAVLAAARRIKEVRAVATIGAPSDPNHVKRLFANNLDTIEELGEARVDIAGREFTITKQFLEDLDEAELGEPLGALHVALLVMHSPTDEIVGIDNARAIYEAARGFKSFLTLPGADHLLTKRRDAEYAAAMIAEWSSRYVEMEEAASTDPAPAEGSVLVAEVERPYTQQVSARSHRLFADEPASFGGNDRGPNPYEYLLASLGACTSMTLRMYAERKKWPLEQVQVTLRHEKIHAEDCERCETGTGRIDRITRDIQIVGDGLDATMRARLLEIADRCPVHRTLEGEKEIVTREVPVSGSTKSEGEVPAR